MQTYEIRKRFLDHFVNAGHTEVPSASVILEDPNLLFVNAGMVQFVPLLPGPAHAAPCHGDQYPEMHSHTRHRRSGCHHPAQHLLPDGGNFSFGDYFKREAITLAWSLLTKPVSEGGYGFDPERLWATVFYDDDEAVQLWQEVAGLPPERIQRRGMADNYWSMVSPDRVDRARRSTSTAARLRHRGRPEANEDRYIEIWNLVFMQNERGEGTGKENFEILGPLPRKNIDTGMGVERIACLLQGWTTSETDLLRPVIDTVAGYAPRGYGQGNAPDDVRWPGHRRPHPYCGDHHRRRCHPVQRRGAATCCVAYCAASFAPPNCWASKSPSWVS